MTVRIRVIPCLDVANGRVVKGVNFVDLKDAGDPVEQARAYDAAGADELCFLDITASHEARGTLLDVVRRTAEVCFMPLTVGGGVRSVEDARELLLAGADKVAVNSAAVSRPEVVADIAEKMGSQCIVASVDARWVPASNSAQPELVEACPELRRRGHAGQESQMTVRIRVIPCLDVANGRVVKGVNFVDLKDAGDPVEQARAYDAAGADELCFLDITASHEARGTLLDVVRRTAEVCFMPLTVGGGVRSVEDARELLLAGADKVAVNSAAVSRPEVVADIAEKMGSQCIVASVDARWVPASNSAQPELVEGHARASTGSVRAGTGHWEIFTHGGRRATGIDAVEHAVKLARLGAGELLVTSMDGDGTQAGYDLELTRTIADAVSVPVIASGGVGTLDHLVEGVTKGHASAVLAASIFHFGTYTIAQAHAALRAAGLPARA